MFKNRQNTLTEDSIKQKQHTDRKVALGEKISDHKETTMLGNLVSVDAAADRKEGGGG